MTRVREDVAFVLEPRGPFSLGEAARFWEGFTPAAHAGSEPPGHLHMAFAVEGSWAVAGVCVREENGAIEGRVSGDVDRQAVKNQVARILSLDVDGRAFEEVGTHDAVVADLQRRYRGLRPVCFYSTYEAAVWAVLSQRVQMRQAARVKDRMRDALGETVDIHGQPMRAFPAPQVLLGLTDFSGLFGSKLDSLHAVAHAALAGDLDAARLRSLPEAEALKQLQALPGIGPFSSELILLRGAGHPDYLTLLEPRFRHAVEVAYQLDHVPTDDDLRRVSDTWRPYRMWVTFLLRQAAELTRQPPAPRTPSDRRPKGSR